MRESPTSKMTPDEVQAYRDSVDTLIVACLERLRAYPLEADDELAPTERPAP
jgi:hypothetical protein